jgi:hypothetical protein
VRQRPAAPSSRGIVDHQGSHRSHQRERGEPEHVDQKEHHRPRRRRLAAPFAPIAGQVGLHVEAVQEAIRRYGY